jgi:hydroxymethylpyrimidine pyrophosphatase-like HAD family hydrolase
MVPNGVTKGCALQNVCNLAGVHPSKTIVIGDYYNDIKIMRQAGYSAAVANAPSEVQALANEVIPSNDEAGVAQFLYKLINRFTT